MGALQNRFEDAKTFGEFLESAEANYDLWHAVYRRATVTEEEIAAARELGGRRHLLVLLEDWCGDAVNTVPVLARLAEAVPEQLELRVLERDRNPALMDTHLTNGGRSIPVVMVLDEEFREIGWWGPRPRELQEWFLREGKDLEKAERYRRIRMWYARDRGRGTVEEVLEVARAS